MESSSDEDSIPSVNLPPQLLEELLDEEDEDPFEYEYVSVCINGVERVVQRVHRVKILNFVEISRTYLDDGFIQHFRLSRNLMYQIVQRYASSQQYQEIEKTPGRPTKSAEHHLLAFTWFAGHQTSSYRDVADRFGVTLSTLFMIISRVIDFLLTLSPYIIRLPSAAEKETIRTAFAEKCGFTGVLGAIDGCHITIDRPILDPDSYVNRKHNYSIHMQGFVDHNSKFLDVFIGYPGSVHDARVFEESTLFEHLGNLCDFGSFILGDSAYPCMPQLMVPYRDNGHLSRAQKNFNKKLSSGRIAVEHAFGILKQRFRQLYHVKLRSIPRIVKFIHACCVLHNMANEDDIQYLEPPAEEENDFIQEEVELEEFDINGNAFRNEMCRNLFLR